MTNYEKERLNDYMHKVRERAQDFIGYPIATEPGPLCASAYPNTWLELYSAGR
jgi:hypothetical protein